MANVSIRNKRFPLDFTSWEFRLKNATEADEATPSNEDGVFHGTNPRNPFKAIEWAPNCPPRLQAAIAAIRFREQTPNTFNPYESQKILVGRCYLHRQLFKQSTRPPIREELLHDSLVKDKTKGQHILVSSVKKLSKAKTIQARQSKHCSKFHIAYSLVHFLGAESSNGMKTITKIVSCVWGAVKWTVYHYNNEK